ncbi:MAG: phosphatase PAP2 family protein [Erysipelotrichaceae bacterium]|nr:phosphatase PAP2 family protein [Erysipelotrichaceae bacterium]
MKINKKLIIPAILTISIGLVAYFLPVFLYKDITFIDVSLPIDDKIPVISQFVIAYFAAFIQCIFSLYILSKQNDELGYKYLTALLICYIFCGICFFLFPTCTNRPEIVPKNIFDKLLLFIYTVDKPINVCPSIHCIWATLCGIMLHEAKGINKSIPRLNDIISLLIYLSTLFTKQHLFIDVVCGILTAIIALLIANKYSFKIFFDKANKIANIN